MAVLRLRLAVLGCGCAEVAALRLRLAQAVLGGVVSDKLVPSIEEHPVVGALRA